MARLVDSIEVPAAKAAILWVMGEYCERVPKIAPDVLRKMAKSFTNEDPAVKMQVIFRLPSRCNKENDSRTASVPLKVRSFKRINIIPRPSTWPQSCV